MPLFLIMSKRRLLVVGWDSADWKIIEPLLRAGQMPMLAKLLAEGSRGNLSTLEPSLSPMLWTTIATSRHPAEHGVHGFSEVRDGRVLPVSAATRRCRAVWNILSLQGLKTNLAGWFATQGERDSNVRLVSNLYSSLPPKTSATPVERPAPPKGTFFPESLAETLAPLRLHPAELGGDILSMFVKDLAGIDQEKDSRLAELAGRLAETFNTHSAATHLMEAEDWDLTMVYYRAIDEISHLFMPFHPPRMEGAPEKDFAHYHDVVNSAYRLHDLLLTRLVDLAGPEAGVLIVSDHGFHSDHLRPRFVPRVPAGIVVWHRPHGIFAASGAGFRKGGVVHGAGLTDITPTILAWFGIPRSREMAGRVLADALEPQELLPDLETWESTDAPTVDPMPFGEQEGAELLEHFAALGYIEELPQDNTAAIEQTHRENSWQLATSLFHSGRFEEALPLLEETHEAVPLRPDFAQRLAHCQIQLGLADEAEGTIAAMLKNFRDATAIDLVRSNIAQLRGDHAAALAILEEIRAKMPEAQGLRHQLVRSYLRLRRWNEAEAVAREIADKKPTDAQAWSAIARCQLLRGEDTACIASAREAVGLLFDAPLAHLALGTSLARLGHFAEAADSFRTAIKVCPDLIPAYRLLAQTLQKLGFPNEARTCMEQARFMRSTANAKAAAETDRIHSAAATRKAERAARPPKPAEPPIDPLDLIIVSGLPRSGTSLMMQILQAGGLPPMTDGQRTADEDNPEGYWEWEEIKKLPKDPRILEKAKGQAVKVISALLPSLPGKHRYKILYMVRPVAQVVNSQWAMLARQGKMPKSEKQHLIKTQEHHSRQIREVLKKSDRVEILEIDYPALIADPQPTLARIADFLGESFTLGPKVEACIKPALHRQRTGFSF